MTPGSIVGRSGQAIAPDGMDEKVGSLPIRRSCHDGIFFLESAWFPTPEELAALNAGRPVILGVSAQAHPIVRMVVEPIPDIIGLSQIDARHPMARRVVVWDEEADAPLDRCCRVDCAAGIAEVYPPDSWDADALMRREGIYTIRTTDPELLASYGQANPK